MKSEELIDVLVCDRCQKLINPKNDIAYRATKGYLSFVYICQNCYKKHKFSTKEVVG